MEELTVRAWDLHQHNTPLSCVSDRLELSNKFCKIALISPTYGHAFMFAGFKTGFMEGDRGAKRVPPFLSSHIPG